MFQDFMEQCFQDYKDKIIILYIDDLSAHSKTVLFTSKTWN